MPAPLDNLVSTWASMGTWVMTALAWDLKARWALRLPEEPGHRAEKYRRNIRIKRKKSEHSLLCLYFGRNAYT